jgi:hypothetical protein
MERPVELRGSGLERSRGWEKRLCDLCSLVEKSMP